MFFWKIFPCEDTLLEMILTATIVRPDAENCSPAISISTVVSAPTAGCETQARKWRTTSSYIF